MADEIKKIDNAEAVTSAAEHAANEAKQAIACE